MPLHSLLLLSLKMIVIRCIFMVGQPRWSATRPNILLICFKIKTCDFHKWQVAANYNLKATNYEAFLVLFVVLFKTPKKESLLKKWQATFTSGLHPTLSIQSKNYIYENEITISQIQCMSKTFCCVHNNITKVQHWF